MNACVRLKPRQIPREAWDTPLAAAQQMLGGKGVPGAKLSVESAVSAFGMEAKAKLSAIAAKGEPEDQLRNPLEQLVAAMAELCGQVRSKLALIGESSLSELHTRPDSR